MLRRTAVIALAAAVLGAGALAAADPFYVDLLNQGAGALERGEPETAARLLRIACFGLLDEPQLLVQGLVRLGLAQHAARDGDGFRDSFRRLKTVEERFEAYSSADLGELRAAYEDAAARHVPEAELAATPAFAELAQRRAELRLQRLPQRDREEALEERVAESPQDARGLLALAEFQVANRNFRRARQTLDRLLALEPGHQRGLCLRGLCAAHGRDCDEALADLATCAASSDEPRLATARLECHVRRKQWSEASAFLTSLEPALRAEPRIAKLATRVARAAPAPAQPADSPAQVAADTEAATPPAVDLEAEIERIRARLAAAGAPADLAILFDDATALADRDPELAEAQLLAGEIAYRASRWEAAVDYLRRAGDGIADRPLCLFYLSVAYYESGQLDAAAETLRRALPDLARTPFVEAYVQRILGSPS